MPRGRKKRQDKGLRVTLPLPTLAVTPALPVTEAVPEVPLGYRSLGYTEPYRVGDLYRSRLPDTASWAPVPVSSLGISAVTPSGTVTGGAIGGREYELYRAIRPLSPGVRIVDDTKGVNNPGLEKINAPG